MEALLSQFSSLADQAMEDRNFDPSRVEDLMKRFEAEAEAELQKAERSHNSLMDAATDEYRKAEKAIRRASKGEPLRLLLVAKAMKHKAPAPPMVKARPTSTRDELSVRKVHPWFPSV